MTNNNNKNVSSSYTGRKYIVNDSIYYRIRDVYKEYLNLIIIKSNDKTLNTILENLNIKLLIKDLGDAIFSKSFTKNLYLIIKDTALIGSNIIKGDYLLNTPLYNIKNKKSFLENDEVLYSYEIAFTDKILKYNSSRIIKFKFEDLKTKCNYLYKACKAYERALLNAEFAQDHNSHLIVKLASESANIDDFRSSILKFNRDNTEKNKINKLNDTLEKTLLTDQYNFSILGTEDKVERVANDYNVNAFNVLKSDLLAKAGIPETILFGNNVQDLNEGVLKVFYDKVNTMFEIYILPFIKDLVIRLGFSYDDITIKKLEYESIDYKSKRIDVLSKTLKLINDLNFDNEDVITTTGEILNKGDSLTNEKVKKMKLDILNKIEELLL